MIRKSCVIWLLCMALGWLAGAGPVQASRPRRCEGVDLQPNEVRIYRYRQYVGQTGECQSFRLESHMRHVLIPYIPSRILVDKVNSIRVGSNVKVVLFSNQRYADRFYVESASQRIAPNGDWRRADRKIRSMIIIRRDQTFPRGALLHGWHVPRRIVRVLRLRQQFFPLPENYSDKEARYPRIWDRMVDKGQHLIIYGDNVGCTLYEHRDFGGESQALPGNAPLSEYTVRSVTLNDRRHTFPYGPYAYFNLRDFSFRNKTSSVIVRDTTPPPSIGPFVHRCPEGQVWNDHWRRCIGAGTFVWPLPPVCPRYWYYDFEQRQCVRRPDRGVFPATCRAGLVWNRLARRCQCPRGTNWNPTRRRCLKGARRPPRSASGRRCPSLFYWHLGLKRCIPMAYGRRPCPDGTIWRPGLKVCGPRGQTYQPARCPRPSIRWDGAYNRHGRTYRTITYRRHRVNTHQACANECLRDARCRAFVWIGYGQNTPASSDHLCRLKNGLTPRVACQRCASGVKVCHPEAAAGVTPAVRPGTGQAGRRCPAGYFYHQAINKCIPGAYGRRPCPQGTIWHPKWKVCAPKPLAGQRRCPRGRYWHQLLKRCIRHAYGRQPCPPGSVWHPRWRYCGPRRQSATRRCPQGQYWAPRYKKCLPRGQAAGRRCPQGQYWAARYRKCLPIRAGQLSQQPAGNVNAYNQGGLTPLHLAVKAGRLRMVQMLIKRGANVNAPARVRGAAGGSTPLHFAVYYAKSRIAQVLINRGANVNARTMSGSTPLHVAAFYGRPTIAMMLLRRGANVNARDRRGLTPLRVATMRRKARMVGMLRSRGGRM
jgi:hypothetical protein